MKILSIDIETTGLDPNKCQILEIGAVYFDTEKDTWREWVQVVEHDHYEGEPAVLAMHARLFSQLAKGEGTPLSRAISEFVDWVDTKFNYNEKIVIAGKNFGKLDFQFLRKTEFVGLNISHRFLDPGCLLFDPTVDTEVPSTATCLERCGLKPTGEHTALGDALDVARIIKFYFQAHKSVAEVVRFKNQMNSELAA